MAEGSRTPSRNRHGVPMFGGDRPRCCWPGCRVTIHRDDLHMCKEHLVGAFKKIYKDPITDAVHEAFNEFRNQLWLDQTAAYEARSKKARTRATGDGVVYYVKNAGHIKIGWTSDLPRRMRQYPPGCELMAHHAGTRADETALHQRFAVHRSHGREWYPLAPVVLDHIQRMVAEHGQPDRVDFTARPVSVPQARQKQFVAMRSRSGGTFGRAG